MAGLFFLLFYGLADSFMSKSIEPERLSSIPPPVLLTTRPSSGNFRFRRGKTKIIELANSALFGTLQPTRNSPVEILHVSTRTTPENVRQWRFILKVKDGGNETFTGLLISKLGGRQSLDRSLTGKDPAPIFRAIGIPFPSNSTNVDFLYDPDVVDPELAKFSSYQTLSLELKNKNQKVIAPLFTIDLHKLEKTPLQTIALPPVSSFEANKLSQELQKPSSGVENQTSNSQLISTKNETISSDFPQIQIQTKQTKAESDIIVSSQKAIINHPDDKALAEDKNITDRIPPKKENSTVIIPPLTIGTVKEKNTQIRQVSDPNNMSQILPNKISNSSTDSNPNDRKESMVSEMISDGSITEVQTLLSSQTEMTSSTSHPVLPIDRETISNLSPNQAYPSSATSSSHPSISNSTLAKNDLISSNSSIISSSLSETSLNRSITHSPNNKSLLLSSDISDNSFNKSESFRPQNPIPTGNSSSGPLPTPTSNRTTVTALPPDDSPVLNTPPKPLSIQRTSLSDNQTSESSASVEIPKTTAFAHLSDSQATQNETSNASPSIHPNILPPVQSLTGNSSETPSSSITVEANASQSVFVNGSELSSSQHSNSTKPSLFQTDSKDANTSEKDLRKRNSSDALQTIEDQIMNISNETPVNSTNGDIGELRKDLSSSSSKESSMISSIITKAETPTKKTKEVPTSHAEERPNAKTPKEPQAPLPIPSQGQSEPN